MFPHHTPPAPATAPSPPQRRHQLTRLTDAYLGNVIPLAGYQRRRPELGQRVRALQKQVQALESQVDRQAELAGLVTSVTEFCQRVQKGLSAATPEHKCVSVELLMDRVVVTNG